MRIVDFGTMFGYPVSNIFDPWKPQIDNGMSLSRLQAEIKTIDLICFGGGQDISPALYGHRRVGSSGPANPSQRDLFEREVWKIAQTHKTPVLGICRGAQLVCALSGGALLQDIAGHAKAASHPVTTNDGQQLALSSYHHQMMYPNDVKHELVAWVVVPNPELRGYSFDQTKIQLVDFLKEPEVVYFPDTNAVSIQAHPEYRENPDHEEPTYARQVVNKYLFQGKYA